TVRNAILHIAVHGDSFGFAFLHRSRISASGHGQSQGTRQQDFGKGIKFCHRYLLSAFPDYLPTRLAGRPLKSTPETSFVVFSQPLKTDAKCETSSSHFRTAICV